MKIVWSPLARRDLEQIEGYIRDENPIAARETAATIKSATRRLAEFPGIGRPGRWPGTRELVVPDTPYIIPYTVKDKEIWIIAVMHAARKWPEEP